jgi:hypothetical protein
MTALDLISMAFGVCALVAIIWACWRAKLLVRGVDRYEDGEESDERARQIVEASRPAPLTWDNAYAKRPHIRAGEKQ